MNTQTTSELPTVNLGNPPEISSEQLAAALRTGRPAYQDLPPEVLERLRTQSLESTMAETSSLSGYEEQTGQATEDELPPMIGDLALEPAPTGDIPDDGYLSVPEASISADEAPPLSVVQPDQVDLSSPAAVEMGDEEDLKSAMEPDRDWKEDPYVYWMSDWLERMADEYPSRLAMVDAFRADLTRVLERAEREGIVDVRAPAYVDVNHFVELTRHSIESIDRYVRDRDAKYEVDLSTFAGTPPSAPSISEEDLIDDDERPREPPSPKFLPNGELEMSMDEMLALHSAHLIGPTREALHILHGPDLSDIPDMLATLRLREEKAAQMREMANDTDMYSEVRGTSMDPSYVEAELADRSVMADQDTAKGSVVEESDLTSATVSQTSASVSGRNETRYFGDELGPDSTTAVISATGVDGLDRVAVDAGHVWDGDPGPEPDFVAPNVRDALIDPSELAANVEQMNMLNERASVTPKPYVPISPFSQLTPEDHEKLQDHRRPSDKLSDEDTGEDVLVKEPSAKEPQKPGPTASNKGGAAGAPESKTQNTVMRSSAVESAIESAIVTAAAGVIGLAKGLTRATKGFGSDSFRKNSASIFQDALIESQRDAAEKLAAKAEKLLLLAESETDPDKAKMRLNDVVDAINAAVLKTDQIANGFSGSARSSLDAVSSTVNRVKSVTGKTEDLINQRIKDGLSLEEQLASIVKFDKLLENILERLQAAFNFVRVKMGSVVTPSAASDVASPVKSSPAEGDKPQSQEAPDLMTLG